MEIWASFLSFECEKGDLRLFCKEMERRDSGVKSFLRVFGAFGLAELVTATVLAPIERYQILRQTQMLATTLSPYSGLRNYLLTAGKTEGILALWKGNLAGCFRLIVSSVVRFRCYPLVHLSTGESEVAAIGQDVWLGLAVLLAAYPLDLVRTRLAADIVVKGAEPGYFGVFECLSTTMRTSGLKSGFQGFSLTFATLGPYIALARLLDRSALTSVPKEWEIAYKTSYLAVLQTLFYPFDTLRKRLQVSGAWGKAPKYSSAWNCLATSLQKEGFFTLYQGWPAHMLRLLPSLYLFQSLSRL